MSIKNNHKLLLSYALIIFWMGLIFWFSSHNSTESTQQSSAILNQLNKHGAKTLSMHEVRKSAHFTLYMILGTLFINLMRVYKFKPKKMIGFSILFSALYAISDEFHQLFITGRSSEIKDVFIDTVGATTGILIFYLIHKFWVGRKRQA